MDEDDGLMVNFTTSKRSDLDSLVQSRVRWDYGPVEVLPAVLVTSQMCVCFPSRRTPELQTSGSKGKQRHGAKGGQKKSAAASGGKRPAAHPASGGGKRQRTDDGDSRTAQQTRCEPRFS
jgi:hypothetical protein